MTMHEQFELKVLSVAPTDHYVMLKPMVESTLFDTPEPHICQLLEEWWQRKFISLHTFDGQKECSLEDWLRGNGTADSFFHNAKDQGHVRVRLLVAGAERRDVLKKNPIGFVAKA